MKQKALFLVGSLLLTVLLLEGILGFFPRMRPVPRTHVGEYQNSQRMHFEADDTLGWKMKAEIRFDIYESNPQGFRSPFDFDIATPEKKIIFAGDSFTYGLGVKYPDLFSALVESDLPGARAYNLGIMGYGLDQIWLSVRSQGLPRRPNLVVVSFISADLTRSQEAFRPVEGFNKPVFHLVEGHLVPKTAADRPTALIRFLQHHSSIWRVARLADRTLAHRFPHSEWWNLNAAILDAIREDCRRAEVPLLFVYIPTREWWAFPSLRSYMARVGAGFIDLTKGPYALTPAMYSPVHDHLNERGHRQVADAILNWLRANPHVLEENRAAQ